MYLINRENEVNLFLRMFFIAIVHLKIKITQYCVSQERQITVPAENGVRGAFKTSLWMDSRGKQQGFNPAYVWMAPNPRYSGWVLGVRTTGRPCTECSAPQKRRE